MSVVTYEGFIDHSKAAELRLIRAAFKHNASIQLLGWQHSFWIKLKPEQVEDFSSEVKLHTPLRYCSPTRFDNGTLIPLYKSPKEELDARIAEARKADNG